MKTTNKDLKKCRDEVSKLQTTLFNTLGGDESYAFRIKLGDISNDLLKQMKENEINGDESILYF
jgi:hypothetical protein